MTLNTRQHTLPIRTVLLERVVLVIESHLAVLVGLAILAQDHLFRLCLTLFFLDRNHAYAPKRQKQDEKYFHKFILATNSTKNTKVFSTRIRCLHIGMRKVGPEWQRLQSLNARSPPKERLPL